MNILTSEQLRQADQFTIGKQKISSAKLMERAATAFVKAFSRDVKKSENIAVVCGSGNNGGDGLAIARLLFRSGYTNLKVYVVKFSKKSTGDQRLNLTGLQKTGVEIKEINDIKDARNLDACILIDAILGSGLNKPLAGKYKQLVELINKQELKVYAVDIPSGFPAEGNITPDLTALKATKVISFQQPKLNFFFPESAAYLNAFKTVNIDLDTDFINNAPSNWKLTGPADVRKMVKPRKDFSNKGTFGHALLIAGQEQTMGAAILAAKACLFAGAGLTTACIPQSGLTALNTALPEVMYQPQSTTIQKNADKYSAIAIGPGIGTTPGSLNLLNAVLQLKRPLLADADALNLFAANKGLLKRLPGQSILTPHMKEFDRLFGPHKTWWERIDTAVEKAKATDWIIVLKNRFTFIVLPDGHIHINPTGNPAMASGGMGDVLTGIIAALLAQGYSSGDAAILACYLHGKAGEKLAKKMANVTASQVAEQVPVCIKNLLS